MRRYALASLLLVVGCSEAPTVTPPPPSDPPARDGGVAPDEEETARLFLASGGVTPVATFPLGRTAPPLELLPPRPQDYGFPGNARFRGMEATPDGTRVVAQIDGDDSHLVVFDATAPQEAPVELFTGQLGSWRVVSNDHVVWTRGSGVDPEDGTYVRALDGEAPARLVSRTLRVVASVGDEVMLLGDGGAFVAHRLDDGSERQLSSLTQRFALPVFVFDDRIVVRRNDAMVAYDVATLTSTVVADVGRCPEPLGVFADEAELLCSTGDAIDAYRLDGAGPARPRRVASEILAAMPSAAGDWLWTVGLDGALARRPSDTGVVTATTAVEADEALEAISSDGRYAVLRGRSRDALIDAEGVRRFSAELPAVSSMEYVSFDPSSRYFLYEADFDPYALDLESGETHRLPAQVSAFAAGGAVGAVRSEGLRLYRSEGDAPAEALGPWHPTTLYAPVVRAGYVITDRRHEGVWKTSIEGTATKLADDGAFAGMTVVGDFAVGVRRGTGRVEAYALDGAGASEHWEELPTTNIRVGGRYLAAWWSRGASVVAVDGVEDEPVEFSVTDATIDDVRWSNAIERFVVSITTDTETRIVALAVDGVVTELATFPRFQNPTVLLTETHAFVTRYRGAPGTWSVPLEGGEARQVSEAGRLERLFAESNRALIVDSAAVTLVDLETLAAETVIAASTFVLGAASRDDTRQAFVADDVLHVATWSPLRVAPIGEGQESLGFTFEGDGLYHVDAVGKLSVFELALGRSRALTEEGVRIDRVDPVDADTLIVRTLVGGEPRLQYLDDGRLRPLLEVPDAEERYLPLE